jgi:hypothetical protein
MVNPVENAPATPGLLAQRVLAVLVRSPSRPLSHVADEILARASPDLREATLDAIYQAVRQWRVSKGKKESDAVVQDPSLADRILIRKNLLRRAKFLIKRSGRKLNFPVPPDKLYTLFCELTQTTEGLCREFLAAICEALEVGLEGEFVSSYSRFLNNTPLFQKPPRNAAWVRRVIRWIFSDLEVRFVRLGPPEVCREVATRRVREEFFRRWGLGDVDEPGLANLVDEQLDRWLQENGLAGPAWPPPDLEEQKKIVGDFWERRRAEEISSAGAADEVRREPKLADEVRTLREQMADLPDLRLLLGQREAEVAALRNDRDGLQAEAAQRQEELARPQGEGVRVKASSLSDWIPAEFRELRALLTLVDEKYPLESLNELVVAGLEPEPPVTLRQFVSHLLFALRKRGLAYYPDQDEFDLNYNDSALYDCVGFEVAPGSAVRVTVRSKGWALRNGRTLIPIRRARVQLA